MRIRDFTAKSIRLPPQAIEAIEQGDVIAVTHYGRRRAVVLGSQDFALIEPLLELLKQGATMPAELSMTAEDISLERDLAADRESSPHEDALIEQALATGS